MNQLHHHYESVFAPYIEGLILQKKADGFIYELEAYITPCASFIDSAAK